MGFAQTPDPLYRSRSPASPVSSPHGNLRDIREPVAFMTNGSGPLPQYLTQQRPDLAASNPNSLAHHLKALQELRCQGSPAPPGPPVLAPLGPGPLVALPTAREPAPRGSLSEALKRWPSPESPEQSAEMPAELAAEPESECREDASHYSQDPAVFEPPEEDEETLHEEDEVPEEPFAPEERTPQQVPEERVPEEREETPEERHYQEHMRERAQERVTKTYSSMGSRNRSSQLASRARRLSLPEVQDESQRCREALIACAKEISTKEVREMRMLKKALPQVSRILDAVSLLLDGGSSKKLLADSLPARLESYNPGTMTLQQRNKVAALLTAETKPEAVAKLYKPAVSLARWCECITVFLARTEPLLDEDEPESGPDYPAAKRVSSQMSSQPSYAQEREMPRRRETGLLVEPELSKLSPSQLQTVPNLTITKPGVGSVTFHGITDCTDLDVEKDVVLKRGYVLVYPDTKKKPAVGQGLNKHATVTMFQCFPPGEPVKTLSDDAVQEYKDKIRRMTEENSACKFIDYDCQTGVWKFEVDRF